MGIKGLKWTKISLLLGICGILIGVPSHAQKRLSRHDLQKKIHLTDQLLNETENHQDKTLHELTVLDKRIRLRKRLLYQLSADIANHSQTIEDLEQLICEMEEDIGKFMDDYGKTAQLTYQKLESNHYLLSILSSESFSQAYQQAIYFRQLRQFHRRKIRLLRESQTELDHRTFQLQTEIQEKQSLIQQKKREVEILADNKNQQEEVYASLKNRVSTFRSQLSQQQSQLKKLIKQSENIFLASADRVDSEYGQNFPRNKGFLPWPISSSRGVIVGKFGKTEDPYGNQIENEGIYIRTPKGQLVRSVYSGKVSGVQQIPMSGYVVIIEHGEYRTVYANLKETYVKPGELVSANQQIGTVRTEIRTNETVLNFLIYKMPDKFLNPEGWMIDP